MRKGCSTKLRGTERLDFVMETLDEHLFSMKDRAVLSVNPLQNFGVFKIGDSEGD
jgi:hypothetical protein